MGRYDKSHQDGNISAGNDGDTCSMSSLMHPEVVSAVGIQKMIPMRGGLSDERCLTLDSPCQVGIEVARYYENVNFHRLVDHSVELDVPTQGCANEPKVFCTWLID